MSTDKGYWADRWSAVLPPLSPLPLPWLTPSLEHHHPLPMPGGVFTPTLAISTLAFSASVFCTLLQCYFDFATVLVHAFHPS